MKYIVLFLILFFVTYKNTFALPFLWVVPFVFDLGILLYTWVWILLSGGLYFLCKYKERILIFSSLITLWLVWYLYFLVGYWQWKMINLQVWWFFIDYEYIIYVSCLWFIVWFFLYLKWRVLFFLMFIHSILLLSTISLLYSVYTLNIQFKALESKFSLVVNNSLEDISPQILNNIFISQDYKYESEGILHLCRITLSYYTHKWNYTSYVREAYKTDELNLYIGLDTWNCKAKLDPIFKNFVSR